MALCIQLFTSLQEVDPKLATRILGFQSMASLVATVIVTNLGLLLIFVGLTVYHTVFRKSMRVLRLVSSREVPDLQLGIGMQYHVFLSHIWSSGQDQTANIKRMLQLLLPGANIFLGSPHFSSSLSSAVLTLFLHAYRCRRPGGDWRPRKVCEGIAVCPHLPVQGLLFQPQLSP
eukprot:3763881-Prymnesium_polylepis.1